MVLLGGVVIASPYLFLKGFLPRGGHFGCGCALAGAAFQQVNPGGACALFVVEVEEDILVKSEELVMPAAVLGGLLA